MKPIDFIVFDGDSRPNMPAHKVYEAIQKDIIIVADDGEFEVLSYFIENANGRFVLEIQKKVVG